MGDYYQYYYALGESDESAVDRVRETVRFLMSVDCVGVVVRAGSPVANADVDTSIEWALAHKDIQHDKQRWSTYTGPRDGIIPMLGTDWGTSGSYASLPLCPHCGSDVDFNDNGDGTGWLRWFEEGVEPLGTCRGAGHTGLIGDFDMYTTEFFRTNCGVALENWPNLPQYGGEIHEQTLGLIGRRPMYTIRKS
ncbi:hypothetical protein ACIBEH_22045 [Nocardia salmonicida]|uniref:hypothetical protein n=1 Tax=Nocardia salmonicida TaxID=53431 RepID=UPI0037A960FE